MTRLVSVAAVLLLGSQAGAVVIDSPGDLVDGTDVGNIDDFIASTGVLSGEQAEADWVNGELGTSFTKDDL
ncbi:MAG TPA: hypothetical protein VE175_13390, partial [Woeseiaceae bacterium]|nr:hypothetical protein [Woeseiaceae bacterium]